jgi:hypothetical protein
MSGHADTIRERTRYWQDSGGRYVVAASDFDALVAENQQLRDVLERIFNWSPSDEVAEWARAALAGTPSEDT